MNYQQTLDFLYSKLPMFTRIGASAFKKDLTNTIILCEALDNPQDKFKSIHVAGTNGKGSTSHMLASVLQAQGYKTGLYTSPHLKDFRERIRINGKMMSKTEVVLFVKEQQKLIEKTEPSFFEVTVAMAFDHFAKHEVDVAVIEVGLGGRLDSTNIITPQISVITNISLDHMNMLGNTLAEIAGEKAGIIKKNIPVVIGETQEESAPVFIDKAKSVVAPIVFADAVLTAKDFKISNHKLSLSVYQNSEIRYKNLQSDLTGVYQHKNILTVLETLAVLNEKTDIKTNIQAIYKGISQVKKQTGLQGRWQTLAKNPLIICDTGHNEAGIAEVIKNINQTPYQNLHIVFGMVNDKDISKVLSLMPKNATYYFCKPDLERGLAANELKEQAATFNLIGNSYVSVAEAKENAIQSADSKDLVFIGGSTFVVAEAI
ncbi:bifunctional folylpolyglutamate synthase/dihydrofolate synthase [Pedobacter sp. ISL-68]|uniref:bifunctional folylpolyglutamate synthase/dihydrofolate synthase n=1 Tax=unclassified Pedobacter TaxID=2628915 RepID=UPI001BEBB1D8|nr:MULTISPECIES: folylpolyglutamate synthase/dihydrofolate synthase family protein [unclassified Pedobacter]MBT2564028.1 bifunctional folylpolyglutamate synthase/dihydrofolate synthase [Pedobacter sp. ISL-64]MBT2592565.1 bifunctional folylpolyglutamate synthase/dihydrofolate synthase [Pedobacter sp. ISL-68]